MKIIVYAYTCPETMHEKAIEHGMTEKAANYFRYFNEVELELTVEDKTGEVTGAKLTKDWSQKCRVCGCTDLDCSQCIEATGHPCWWVEEDLCSRCNNEMQKGGDTVEGKEEVSKEESSET